MAIRRRSERRLLLKIDSLHLFSGIKISYKIHDMWSQVKHRIDVLFGISNSYPILLAIV